MKLGAEPKKVAILGVLVALAGYLFYTNLFSGGDPAPRPAPKTMVLDTGPEALGNVDRQLGVGGLALPRAREAVHDAEPHLLGRLLSAEDQQVRLDCRVGCERTAGE